MMNLRASKVCIKEEVCKDPTTQARAERLLEQIETEEVLLVDDSSLSQIVEEENLNHPQRHGSNGDFEPIVIFNRFRFDDSEETRKERREKYPHLFETAGHKFSGYGGFDWRESGTPKWRAKMGIVCQPAYQLHTIVGCPFRCDYCSLGRFFTVMLNIEELVGRLDDWLAAVPNQTLYQYDNWTDTVCFEPEYGGVKLLVEYFAEREKEYLELYVGKSDNIDYILDLDHRGHTIACWSVSGETQSTKIEKRTASMMERIEAARKCQEAGYHVRFRFSPIIPVKNWKKENREMIEMVFERTRPDVITFETLRFLDYNAITQNMHSSLLDEEWLATMRSVQGQPHPQGCEIPDELRHRVYRFIIDEIERVSPETPYAICRGLRKTWDAFIDDFARHGMSSGNYVCNCGPLSTPGNELLTTIGN